LLYNKPVAAVYASAGFAVYEQSVLVGKIVMNNGIFRKKGIDKITSPEKLDDYIRVTTPSVWLVLAAVVLLLVGALVWGFFGEVEIHNADGTSETVAPITFVTN